MAVSRKTGCPLYCGEFGVVNTAPMAVREAWYRDIISVFEEHGIGWANWDYKGQFGIVDRDRQSTGIAEAMLACVAPPGLKESLKPDRELLSKLPSASERRPADPSGAPGSGPRSAQIRRTAASSGKGGTGRQS